MLSTRFAGGLRARPLEPRPNRDAGIIWFVTDLHSAKEYEIESENDVGLSSSTQSPTPISDHGARRNMARRCQGGRNLEVHRQHVVEGTRRSERVRFARHSVDRRVMDGPSSKAVAAFEFAKARLTDGEPNLGEHRKVTVDMR